MSEPVRFKRGELLQLSSGEYEDYGVGAVLRARKAFDLDKAVFAYIQQQPVPSWQKARLTTIQAESDFEAWLITKGYVVAVDCGGAHLGDYIHRWDYEELFGVARPEEDES